MLAIAADQMKRLDTGTLNNANIQMRNAKKKSNRCAFLRGKSYFHGYHQLSNYDCISTQKNNAKPSNRMKVAQRITCIKLKERGGRA